MALLNRRETQEDMILTITYMISARQKVKKNLPSRYFEMK
jgi:hypothetical protein